MLRIGGKCGIKILFVIQAVSSKNWKKLQKSGLFIDDKIPEATMIAGHLRK